MEEKVKSIPVRKADFTGYGDAVLFGPAEDKKSIISRIPEETERMMANMFDVIDKEGNDPDLETLMVIIHAPGHKFERPFGEDEILDRYTLGVRVETHKKKED